MDRPTHQISGSPAPASAARSQGPIFIVGMNGSGTTLLLDCLSSHPLLYGFPRETKVIPYFLKHRRRYGDLHDDANFLRLWNDLRNIPDFRVANKGTPPPLPDDWRDTSREVGAVANAIFSRFAARAGKQRWCEKTPLHALHILELSEAFPGSLFLHIIRDGRASAASYHRRWGYHPQLAIFRWKNVVREAQRQGRLIRDRYHELRYEELIEHPDVTMTGVCEFLGVPFDTSVLVPSRNRVFATGTREKKILDRRSHWHSYFDQKQLRSLDRIGGAALHELGYPTELPTSDFNPNPMRRWGWMIGDYLRASWSLIQTEFQQRRKNRLRNLFQQFLRAARQHLTGKF